MSGSVGVKKVMTLDLRSPASSVTARLDRQPVAKRIGLVALATDHTTETDFARMVQGHDVGVYVNRIEFENPITHESLLRTGPRLTAAAADILPDEPLDVLVYGCTSASAVLGNAKVAEYMNRAKPDTPYAKDVTDTLVRYFAEHGPEVVSAECFGLSDDRDMARVSLDSIIDGGVAACAAQADALFVSCTALRAASCVAQLEARLGKPVITSNQAMVWRCMRHLGLTGDFPAGGTLFKT
jgi:maleate isomerase